MSDGNPMFGLPVLNKYRPVPYFFFYDLMPLSKGIPPMFWKFTFGLWCDLTAPTPVGDKKYVYNFTCAKSMRKWQTMHGVNKSSAIEYTAAYRCSGMFEVSYGFKHIEMFSGQPTVYKYRASSTEQDWRAFIVGLTEAYRTAKDWGMGRHGKLTEEQIREQNERTRHRNMFKEISEPKEPEVDEKPVDSFLAFQLLIATKIDEARLASGLSAVNTQYRNELIEQGAGARENGGIAYKFRVTDRSRLDDAKPYIQMFQDKE